jgi:hypothetical protein
VIHRSLESGLVLAEQGMDGAALERELRKRDPLLALQGFYSPAHGAVVWRVVREAGAAGPETVCVWQSESGEPYPLSSGLLDLVDRLDRNTRHGHHGEDELNAARNRELDRQVERDRQAIVDDHLFKHGRPLLPRSQSLRMSRDKQRAKGRKV